MNDDNTTTKEGKNHSIWVVSFFQKGFEFFNALQESQMIIYFHFIICTERVTAAADNKIKKSKSNEMKKKMFVRTFENLYQSYIKWNIRSYSNVNDLAGLNTKLKRDNLCCLVERERKRKRMYVSSKLNWMGAWRKMHVAFCHLIIIIVRAHIHTHTSWIKYNTAIIKWAKAWLLLWLPLLMTDNLNDLIK